MPVRGEEETCLDFGDAALRVALCMLFVKEGAGMQDFIAWHFDEKGVHSVKRAYKLHVKMHEITNELEAGRSGDVHGSLDACESTFWSRI